MHTLKILAAFLLLSHSIPSRAAYPSEYLYHNCPDTTTYTANSTYQSNLKTLLSALSSNSARPDLGGFYNTTSGDPPGEVIQGLFQCRGDLSFESCQECVTLAATDVLQRCPNNKVAIIQYDYCLLRYSNQSIFSRIRTSPASYMWNEQNVSSAQHLSFNDFVRTTLTETASEAANKGSKFMAKETIGNVSDLDPIYTLVQCTQDLSADDCNNCLQHAISDLPHCCDGNIGGRVFLPSCYVRYEIGPFYNASAIVVAPPPSPVVDAPRPSPAVSGKTEISTVTVVAVAALVVVSLVLLCVACCFLLKRARKKENAVQADEAAYNIEQLQSMQFDFETVKGATSDFSVPNKLGQGGFGAVYKGTLPSGQDVAVKRLSRESRQGELEFKNEVLLVAKLHHRNLVRLEGFCTERDERLLLYEFVPNLSLDHYLFDPIRSVNLDWVTRGRIIRGIARGLLYLHEDSPLRIIHRDLKASNILLDEEMNPKVSDFGMARLFEVDQTRDETSRIVGTFGYMAPEYVIRGRFSVKSDVFSFGVLVLEIASGQKNSGLHNGEDLLTFTWRNWEEGTATNVLDPTLRTGSISEMMRWINIGLLCVQENEADRPTMAQVVIMLSSYSLALPVPWRPPFSMRNNGDNSR